MYIGDFTAACVLYMYSNMTSDLARSHLYTISSTFLTPCREDLENLAVWVHLEDRAHLGKSAPLAPKETMGPLEALEKLEREVS